MIPLWTIQLNKKLISKEKKLLKIKNFNSWNKEIKNTKINKLRLLRDMKRDLSKRRKKPIRLSVIESKECRLKKKVLILNMSKRERPSKNLKRVFSYLKVKLIEKRLFKWKNMKILKDNRKN